MDLQTKRLIKGLAGLLLIMIIAAGGIMAYETSLWVASRIDAPTLVQFTLSGIAFLVVFGVAIWISAIISENVTSLG